MLPDQFTESHDNLVDLKIGLAGAVKDIAINAKVIDKLAEAVEKIEIMNQNLCKMITLHEHKHDSAEKIHGDIDEDLKEVTTRIDALMVLKHDTVAERQQDAEVKKALEQFNRWKFIATGALLVIGYLLAHIGNIGGLFLSLAK